MVSSIVHSSFKNYNVLNDLGPLDEDLEPMDEAQSSAYLHSITRNKIEELSKLLLSSSFDINDQSCLTILKVISASKVVNLSLKNITFHPKWLIKLLLIKEQFPSAQFQFSQRDIQIFEKIRYCFNLYCHLVIPSEMRFFILNGISRFKKYSLDQMVTPSDVLVQKFFINDRKGRFFRSKFTCEDVFTFSHDEKSRNLIDLFRNTSSSEGAFCINDQLHLLNDASNLLHLNDSEESLSADPINALKIKALRERISSHIEKRLQLFYALAIVISSLDLDGSYCKCTIGSTNYQVGSGDLKLQFEAAHSAIIPNPMIELDVEEISKIPLAEKDRLIDYLSKLCIFMGKDLQLFKDSQLCKELIRKHAEGLAEFKSFLRSSDCKRFFSMELVPIESYLGQNLASTVCLPKKCNDFDGIIEKKIRENAAKLLTQLLRYESAAKKPQRAPVNPYTISIKFNDIFTQALTETLKDLKKDILCIEEKIQKLELLEPIFVGLSSQQSEYNDEALRLLSENAKDFFDTSLQLFRTKDLLNLPNTLLKKLFEHFIKSLKEEFRDVDSQFFDNIFSNLPQLKDEKLDEIKKYHKFMITKCDEIFSSNPLRDRINCQAILEKFEDPSLSVKEISQFWESMKCNILQNKIYFWFENFSRDKILEFIKKEISSVLCKDQATVDSSLSKSRLEQTMMVLKKELEPIKEKLELANFLIKRFEEINPLTSNFFESFRVPSPTLELKLDAEEVKNPQASGMQSPKDLDKLILKRAKECLLAPFLTINKVKINPLKPAGFLNQPIFYIIERVKDSNKYSTGLKISFDDYRYCKLEHFSRSFKWHLKQRFGDSLQLKIGQKVCGVFFV
jgi:hypothetical protein